MKNLIFFLQTSCFILASFAFGAERPNILYLYVDDLGWGSIGPNGQAERKAAGKPYVLTPNLDRLAEQGINFTRGYGCTVCSPARSSQQTGFHQGYTFADRNDPDNAKKAIRKDDITMGDALTRLAMLPDIGVSGDMVDLRICKIRLSIMCRLFPLLTDTSLLSRNSIMYVPIPFSSQPFGMHLRNEG